MSDSKPSARSVLLDTQDDRISAEDIDYREKQFFNQLVLANGTLKTTFAGRLTDVDAICNRLLQDLGQRASLLDVAVSSGVTTYEWVRALEEGGVEFSMDAFDLCADGIIYSTGKNFHVLVDSSGRPLQFELFASVVENSFGESFGRKARRLLPVSLLRAAFLFRKHTFGRFRHHYPVKLVTRHLRDSDNIRVFEHDLTDIDQLPRSYDMIRAANILNLAYFNTDFLRDALTKINSRLNDGGYLCVVRTHSDASNHGTVFKKDGERFIEIDSVGSGSEIEGLVI